jgi:cobalt-zinc-cadmium efflux system membrane fusion protein
MTDTTRVTIGRGTATVLAAGLLLLGAAVTVLVMRSSGDTDGRMPVPAASPGTAERGKAPPAPPETETTSSGPLPDLEIALSTASADRAGIEVAAVAASSAGAGVRIPGVVEPDAYKRVVVTPLVGGRITRVRAELGAAVSKGSTLASIYSPGLADVQTKYVASRAERDALAQELARTERLVEIGAASRQELERVRAAHTAAATSVEAARSQLLLLGMSPADINRLTVAAEISAAINVIAPLNGVVVERQANVGLNVEPSSPLFTVVDLSSVWVVADLYERDFGRVRVGSPATITTAAYPGLTLTGRVSYIDPQLNAQTRTARVRVEVPNRRDELKLGMYAEMQIHETAAPAALSVPRSAVQTIGDRHFVYLAIAGQQGRYIEREVRLASSAGDSVEVVSGLRAGDVVVTKGSFFLRAERERLGLRPPSAPATTPVPSAAAASPQLRVTITAKGFEPDRLSLPAGQISRVSFLRTTDETCAKEILVPSLNVKRALPLNQPVVIEVRAGPAGHIAFTCGMNMLKGTLVVQ